MKVEYLIAIAELEGDRYPSRQAEVMQALERADLVIAERHGDLTHRANVGITSARAVDNREHKELLPTCVLRQRVLFARGQQCIASGK